MTYQTRRSQTPFPFIFPTLLAAVFFAGIAGAQEEDRVPCATCNKTGAIVCDRHKKDVVEKEEGTIRCSELISCKECRGTFQRPCTRCKNPPKARVLKAWKDNEEWLAKMREIDALLRKKKNKIIHGESEHFLLTFDVKSLPVGQVSCKAHGGMHLYLERLEKLYVDVSKDLGAGESDYLAKTHVMIWEKQRDVTATASKYCHQTSNTKSYLIGAKPVFTIHYNKGFLHEEFELHQAVVHNVVHCLLSNVWDGMWPGNIRGGWLDAGYAHHYEIKYFGHLGGVRNYCYLEGDTHTRFKFGKWEPTILTLVKNGGAISFIDTAIKNTYLLTPMEHMHAWSYVDFILKKHPDKFGSICRLVKARKPIREVLKKSLGWSPFQFEEKWKEYVRANYLLKPKKSKGSSRKKD
jgi:hypothetical protein